MSANVIKTIRLANNLLVGSFANNFQILFEEGTKIPPMPVDEFKKLKVNYHTVIQDIDNIQHIRIVYAFSPVQNDMIKKWIEVANNKEVDVVLVPVQFMSALFQSGKTAKEILETPFRCLHIIDRTHNIASCDKFTIPF